MAITKNAKKAIRSSARKRVFNVRRARALRETVKTARAEGAKDAAAIAKAYQAIDKALKRGVIKKNTAARKKSRLMKLIKKQTTKK